jgi:uracil permease
MFKTFFGGCDAKTVTLGIQHTFVMFGATVLVPIITGLDVGVALFAAGIGTIIFHIVTGFKVPIFLGSSFAFIPPIAAITSSGGSLPQALGGIVIAGILYIIVSIILRYVEKDALERLLPAHITGPMIVLIGLMLAPIAVQNASGAYGLASVKGVMGCWMLALFTLGTGIFVKIFFENKGNKFISTLPVLISLVAGYTAAVVFGFVDYTVIKNASWIGVPNFTLPEFNITAISIAVPVAIVTIIEHFGDVIAIGNVVGKDFVKDPGISRTLIGDGIATSLSAMIGGPANTTYSENTGAIALTGNHNPVIMRVAALFAIFLSFIPKFTAIISTIPSPVIGGISILLFGMIASIGIKSMVDARIDLTDPRILIITATMFVLGLGGAEWFFGPVKLSGLGLSAIVGITLNLVINKRSVVKNR